MVTNSLRLEDIRRDAVKELTRIQNQNGIKHNRMGQDQTGVFQLQIRYAPYSANQWLSPTLEAPSDCCLRGFSCFSDTPPAKDHGGYFKGRGITSRSGKIYRVTVSRWRWPFSIGPVFRAIIRRKYVSQRRSQYEQ